MRLLFLFAVFIVSSLAYSQVDAKLIDENGPDFLLGKPTKPNMFLFNKDNPDMGIKAGIRYQGTAEITENDGANEFDAYGRRVRFEFGVKFSKQTSFTMDVRNDQANRDDKGEGEFNVGDAYIKSTKLLGTSLLNFKGYRGKVDVSRTETVKSAWVIAYDRPKVADEAAQYVNHNRRASNAQLYGDWDKKIHYSVVIGDGVHSEKFSDALGNKAFEIVSQNPVVGGKLIFSPIPGWEQTIKTESYFGVGQHLALGAGYFNTSNIKFLSEEGGEEFEVDRALTNIEFSAHYLGWFVGAEYFIFDNMIEDFTAEEFNEGKSTGWYAISEVVLPSLWYLAPFVRYESWDKFADEDDYLFTSEMAGINWYLRGNTTKVGFNADRTNTQESIGDDRDVVYRLTTQLHF